MENIKTVSKLTTYISVLRGINVGGQKKILMSDLKTLYEELGFINVQTYIQSGNVIFQAGEKTSELSSIIEKLIQEKFSFDVTVIVRTVGELQKTLTVNPYLGKKEVDVDKLHVTLLADVPGSAYLSAIGRYDYTPDKFTLIGKDVFLYCPNGYGISKLSNNFFENKLKVKATTRNWRTISKLVEIATKMDYEFN